MASLAWLLERKLSALEAGAGKARLSCLRLRALVAVMWWEHLTPQALAGWSLADAERLVLASMERFEERAASRTQGRVTSLLEQGPARAVLDWIEAAGIKGGAVFRRITPDGRVTVGALTHAGISSLLSTLLAEGRQVGLVDRNFSLSLSPGGALVA